MVQSNAVLRYLGRKLGLYGANDEEACEYTTAASSSLYLTLTHFLLVVLRVADPDPVPILSCAPLLQMRLTW